MGGSLPPCEDSQGNDGGKMPPLLDREGNSVNEQDEYED
jgi:hypothetical protein